MTHGALEGMRVLDLTQVIAGSYCSMLLADMGADVIKVERPGTGDDTRRMGGSDVENSPAFQAVNRNKRGLAVDLSAPDGRDVIRSMAAQVDVLVENFRPGALARLGLGWEDLREINPGLVYCSISGFGTTGPYADRGGFDLVAQGMSGLMSVTGEPDGPPVKVGVPICDINAGMLGAFGILSAYINKARTGTGQHVDTSLLEAGIATTVWETALFTSFGVVSKPTGSAHRLSAPYEALATSDGFITLGAANQGTWQRLCAALERSDLLTDERFSTSVDRLQNRAQLAEILEDLFTQYTSTQLSELLVAAGVPCGPIYDISQVYDDPHVRAREMLIDVEHSVSGMTKQIGFPVKLSATPGRVRRSAPLLGQDSRSILSEFGVDATVAAALFGAGIVAEPAGSRLETESRVDR